MLTKINSLNSNAISAYQNYTNKTKTDEKDEKNYQASGDKVNISKTGLAVLQGKEIYNNDAIEETSAFSSSFYVIA
ncbi:MAG: hypothetical protein HQK76_08915 [Desulfobacterales bacterium]|nr:hypothetical protein [Desulfobacterales bacterium]